jgi:virginiamycin B lyase
MKTSLWSRFQLTRFWDSLFFMQDGLGYMWQSFSEFLDSRGESAKRKKPRSHILEIEPLEKRVVMDSGGFQLYSTTAPSGITAGPDGNIWFTVNNGTFKNEIGKSTTSGSVTDYSIGSLMQQRTPYDITSGPDGNLWFTELDPAATSGSAIGKITTGGTITEFALPTSGANPHGIVSGPNGALWFTESGANKIGEITTAGTITEFTIPTSSSAPEEITVGPDGNLYFTEKSGNKIGVMTPSGSFTEYTIPTTGGNPYGISEGPDGNMWFTENGVAKVGRMTLGGTFTEWATNSTNYSIIAGPDGNLWFVDSGGAVDRISPTGTLARFPDGTTPILPLHVTVGPDKNIWFTDPTDGYIGYATYILNPFVPSTTPFQGSAVSAGTDSTNPETGNLEVTQPLSFEQSSNPYPGGITPALVYNSDTAYVLPILQATLNSDPNGSVPSQLQVSWTWNNTNQTAVNFGTTGHSAGDTYLMDVQVGSSSAVTSTGTYPWTYQVTAVITGFNVVRTMSGQSQVVVNGSSDPYGPGWSIAGVDQLVTDSSGGLIWVTGTGGSEYFQASGSSYISPGNMFGTMVKNGNGSYTYTAENNTKWNFNSSGLLTSIVSSNNLTTTFTYSSGLLNTVTEPDGGVTTFSYSSGLLSTITEPGNRIVTLTHNASNDLTQLTLPNGTQRNFSYDSHHRLLTDQVGSFATTTYTYDSTTGVLTGGNSGGGVTQSMTPENDQGFGTSSAASAGSAVSVNTDALANVTTYTLDANGRVIKQQNPDGSVQTWTRDFAGNVTAFKDGLGHVTSYSYQYGANGQANMVQETFPDGSVEKFQYNSLGEVTQFQDTLGNLTTYTYDSQGELLTTTNALNQVTTQTWSNGLLQTVTDALGHVTSYVYDSNCRLLAQIDPMGARTTYGYDSAGDRTTLTDALGHITTNTYDNQGNLISSIDPNGGLISYTYNALGEITSRTDQNGHITQYNYDSHGWNTSITVAAGTSVQAITTMVYDADGHMLTKTDPDNHTTSYAYDSVGRLITVTDPLGGVTTTVYDSAGNTLAAIDPLGHATK